MLSTGTIKEWDDARGFGFIAPKDGSRDVFVHISAFAPSGMRPAKGELIMYELGRDRAGRLQAVRAYYHRVGGTAPRTAHTSARTRSHPRSTRRRHGMTLIALALCAALGIYGYQHYQVDLGRAAPATNATALTQPQPAHADPSFRCDGRTHCSQMHSCAEATFFSSNCPNTHMDGDHDGIPCENQWCGH